jgi:PAS domain S-box-containing protein
MKMTKVLFLSFLAIFFQLRWTDANAGIKSVLLLDSYGQDVEPVSTVISAFKTELFSRVSGPLDLHILPLEMARSAQSKKEDLFVTFLRERFWGRQPDLVITVGGPAFIFWASHRNNLFPAAPALIAGITEQVLRTEKIALNAVAVPLRLNLQQVIADILQVLPHTQNIAVILGASQLEALWLSECRKNFAVFSKRINFIYLNNLKFEEIRKRVAALPPNTAILYGLMIVDAAGVPYNPREALKAIVADANSPVFSVHQSFFGLGTVGGRLMQESEAGVKAADAAVRILQGEPIHAISASPLPAGNPVYDWRALKRWGISERRLPPGSIILYRQPSVWKLYSGRIAAGGMLIIAQAFLIVWLCIQRRRRQNVERDLIRSDERLRLITNALPVLIAYVDADRCYQFNNETYRQWFGIRPEEAKGRPMWEAGGERLHLKIAPYVEKALKGQGVNFSLDIESDSGRIRTMETVYMPDKDAHGIVRGFYVLAMDVTERQRAQQESRRLLDQLLHAGRISTLGEFAGAIAHEINQPLSAIMSNTQAAKRYLNAPSPDLQEVKEILPDIEKEAGRAGKVIDRLRALLKKTNPTYQPIDLNSIVQEVVGLLHSDAVIRDVKVSTELDSQLPLVHGDRIQLQQVILNLMLNAFDAVSEILREDRRVQVRTFLIDSLVTTAVCDSGRGVPASEQEMIFKPYYTTKAQGLGMGLSISHSIISRHCGRIWVENKSGGGCFCFSLPPAGQWQIEPTGRKDEF